MYSNVIAFFIFLAVTAGASAYPYGGYPIPFFPTQINGGTEAPEEYSPWLVSLQYSVIPPSIHFCSGALINSEWVVTSGHCASGIPNYGVVTIKAGLRDLDTPETSTQTTYVDATIIHEKYTRAPGPYDIALMKLSTPITTTDKVKPITLPNDKITPTGSVSLAGWGSTWRTHYPYVSNRFQSLQLTVMDTDRCKTQVQKFTDSAIVHDTNICTLPTTNNYLACNSDPGGPLVARVPTAPGQERIDTLEGIVSWGIVPCGTSDAPMIYTKVSSHLNWIREKIGRKNT